jgi:hypothetical protein
MPEMRRQLSNLLRHGFQLHLNQLFDKLLLPQQLMPNFLPR